MGVKQHGNLAKNSSPKVHLTVLCIINHFFIFFSAFWVVFLFLCSMEKGRPQPRRFPQHFELGAHAADGQVEAADLIWHQCRFYQSHADRLLLSPDTHFLRFEMPVSHNGLLWAAPTTRQRVCFPQANLYIHQDLSPCETLTFYLFDLDYALNKKDLLFAVNILVFLGS